MKKKLRIQDDLYNYVNGETLKKLKIPADRPNAGGFAELNEQVETTLRGDFKRFAAGEASTDIPEMAEAIKLYKMVLDVDKRNADGIKPILPYLEKILALKNFDDLNKAAEELSDCGVDLPFSFGVAPDMKDATVHSLALTGPNIILPDTAYYAEGNPAGPALLGVYANMATKLLKSTPLSAEQAAKFVEDTLAFDRLISKSVKSQLEWSNYVNNYNPTPFDEVCRMLAPFDFKALITSLFGKTPEEVVVYDPRAIKEFGQYFNAETFELYVHWAYVTTLVSGAKFLSSRLRSTSNLYRRTLMGIKKDPVIEKQAYQLAAGVFAEPVGVYYGRKYFGEEAKKDVVELVKKIIDTYKLRMKDNAFLDEKTKEKAVAKLSTIVIKMGYPDGVDERYALMKVDENASLLDNVLRLHAIATRREYEDLFKKVDRTKWVIPGHMVNAAYNPSSNDITFPAAILQAPFYSLTQTVSENLGGIGAVIGHEISHAFDNNGAHFDENGNIFNWWKDEDYARFEELTKRMVKQFDGIELYGGKVSGELIVSENIADNGGMAVTLAIMRTLKEKDYRSYFTNWAKIWCMKAKPQYLQMLLANDVHAPAVLRANMQPRNFPEWYEAFGVTSSDKMYLPEDERIVIW